MTSTERPLLTWDQALLIAQKLTDANGWRYRVFRDSLGGWNVVRAGRRPGHYS